jgi:hypothetical protein
MLPMTSTLVLARAAWVMLLALLLAVHSLEPAGFMPAFNHGQVMIVACPDADGSVAPTMGHDHHAGQHHSAHWPCPYAATSSLGALGLDVSPPLAIFYTVASLPLGQQFPLAPRDDSRRPPQRGPPPLA